MRTCAEIEADIDSNSTALGNAYDDLDVLSTLIEALETQAENLFQEWLDAECGSQQSDSGSDTGYSVSLLERLYRLQRAQARCYRAIATLRSHMAKNSTP